MIYFVPAIEVVMIYSNKKLFRAVTLRPGFDVRHGKVCSACISSTAGQNGDLLGKNSVF